MYFHFLSSSVVRQQYTTIHKNLKQSYENQFIKASFYIIDKGW